MLGNAMTGKMMMGETIAKLLIRSVHAGLIAAMFAALALPADVLAQQPSANAILLAREILNVKGATKMYDPVIAEVVDTVPDDLLMDSVAGPVDFPSANVARERYTRYLMQRLAARHIWLAEIESSRAQLRIEAPQHLKARR